MKYTKPETAIILVSEITKGMKSIGSKSLLPIEDNITVIDHQIQYLKKNYNPIEIILCTGFDHEKITQKTKKYKNIQYYCNDNYTNDNQAGSLIKCLKEFNPNNTLVLTNGLLLFEKIKLQNHSCTYFIDNKNRRNYFDIGSNNIEKDGYLFYDLYYKWVELLFLEKQDTNFLCEAKNIQSLSKLFLFELINHIKSANDKLQFIQLQSQDMCPIKINSLKDLAYAKKYYKKYKSVSSQ
jgi:hypothetical protein